MVITHLEDTYQLHIRQAVRDIPSPRCEITRGACNPTKGNIEGSESNSAPILPSSQASKLIPGSGNLRYMLTLTYTWPDMRLSTSRLDHRPEPPERLLPLLVSSKCLDIGWCTEVDTRIWGLNANVRCLLPPSLTKSSYHDMHGCLGGNTRLAIV